MSNTTRQERLAETKRVLEEVREERQQETQRVQERARALLGREHRAREMPMTLTVAQVDAMADEGRRVQAVATATADGLAVNRRQWCECEEPVTEGPELLYYEVLAWPQEGEAVVTVHGFACPSCRCVAQAG